MINIDNLVKEIEDFKANMIIGDGDLGQLFSKSPEEIAKEYTKTEWKPLAQLLGVKISGKELTVITSMVKAYNDLF